MESETNHFSFYLTNMFLKNVNKTRGVLTKKLLIEVNKKYFKWILNIMRKAHVYPGITFI